jgi:hypothetical protein
MTSKPLLQKILKGILYIEDENRAVKGSELSNLKRRAAK